MAAWVIALAAGNTGWIAVRNYFPMAYVGPGPCPDYATGVCTRTSWPIQGRPIRSLPAPWQSARLRAHALARLIRDPAELEPNDGLLSAAQPRRPDASW